MSGSNKFWFGRRRVIKVGEILREGSRGWETAARNLVAFLSPLFCFLFLHVHK